MGKIMKLLILTRLGRGKLIAGTLEGNVMQDGNLNSILMSGSVRFKPEKKVKSSKQILHPEKFLTPSEYRNGIDTELPKNIRRAVRKAIGMRHFWIYDESPEINK
jgi:hypothetical protein